MHKLIKTRQNKENNTHTKKYIYYTFCHIYYPHLPFSLFFITEVCRFFVVLYIKLSTFNQRNLEGILEGVCLYVCVSVTLFCIVVPVCMCLTVTVHIHLYTYFTGCRHCCCDAVCALSWWPCLHCITLFWHSVPPVSVVSVSLPPSLLLLVSNRVLSLSPFSLSSLFCVAHHLFVFLLSPCDLSFSLSLCINPPPPPQKSPPLPHTLFLSSCPCDHDFGVFCGSVCVSSVLIQQRRRGKQRGSTLSVCTLSSPSHPPVSSCHGYFSSSVSPTMTGAFKNPTCRTCSGLKNC